jgi:hypothetical protein
MCLEFSFAFLYLLILLLINFFLVQIIKDSFKKNIRLGKFKKSLTLSSSSNSFLLPFLYLYLEKRLNYQKKEFLFSVKKVSEDVLIIGNFYKFLQQKKSVENSFFYYTNLQEKQYLNNKEKEM